MRIRKQYQFSSKKNIISSVFLFFFEFIKFFSECLRVFENDLLNALKSYSRKKIAHSNNLYFINDDNSFFLTHYNLKYSFQSQSNHQQKNLQQNNLLKHFVNKFLSHQKKRKKNL